MAYIDLDIVALGNFGKSLGITPAENRHFTGKTPVRGSHSLNSLHYQDLAIDWRDWRPDMAPEYEGGPKVHWLERTRRKGERWAQLGILDEVFSPHNDPKGHDSHVHTALKGRKRVPKAFVEWGFTGRWQRPDGGFSFENPANTFGRATAQPKGGQPGATTYTPMAGYSEQVEAVPRYVEMDWRADTASADQRQAETWSTNQGLIQWARANPELAQRELSRRGLSMGDVGSQIHVPENDPRAKGNFKPENRGALSGTLVGGPRR